MNTSPLHLSRRPARSAGEACIPAASGVLALAPAGLLAWLLATLPLPAGAQVPGLHKCVDIDAKVSYQDTPCAPGTAMGDIERDTRAADPAALRRAQEDQQRATLAAEARAGIRVTEDERKVIRADLQRYMTAVARGDNDERCRLAARIRRQLLAAKETPGAQRWNLYADTDCAAAEQRNPAVNARGPATVPVPELLPPAPGGEDRQPPATR